MRSRQQVDSLAEKELQLHLSLVSSAEGKGERDWLNACTEAPERIMVKVTT